MVWAAIICIYSLVGGILIFKYGEFVYFIQYEYYVYGGVAMLVAGTALINIFALANHSWVAIRACKFVWPIAFVLSAVRAILMIVSTNRNKPKLQWECDNGGYLYGAEADSYINGTIPNFTPTTVCSYGVNTFYYAVAIAVVIDLAFQAYMFFLDWRYQAHLSKYEGLSGPSRGGYYDAA